MTLHDPGTFLPGRNPNIEIGNNTRMTQIQISVVPSSEPCGESSYVLTPKAFHNKAQGRSRSERTLGCHRHDVPNPEGVPQIEDSQLSDPFRVTLLCWSLPQGAPASRATLGCGVQPLRGKEHAIATQECADLELLNFSNSPLFVRMIPPRQEEVTSRLGLGGRGSRRAVHAFHRKYTARREPLALPDLPSIPHQERRTNQLETAPASSSCDHGTNRGLCPCG